MARKQTEVKDTKRRQSVRNVAAAPVAPDPSLAPFIEALSRACAICERGAALTMFAHLAFQHGRFQAHDGVVQMQARSIFPVESAFSLSELKLAQALSLIAPADAIIETPEMVRLVRGPLSVRIRKLPSDLSFFDPFKMSRAASPAGDLLAVIKRVAPFMSEDATRPWSTSVLLADGYAWATNNLALVRAPMPAIFKAPLSIPLPAVKLLCALDTLERIEQPEPGRIIVASGKLLFRFSTGAAGWPDLAKLFAKMPKRMPPLPPEMKDATASAARLSSRFVSVAANKVESKSESIDSTYEVALAKGTGLFSARILALIAEVATHAEFSFFPEPIFFRGEGIEGTAVGARETT